MLKKVTSTRLDTSQKSDFPTFPTQQERRLPTPERARFREFMLEPVLLAPHSVPADFSIEECDRIHCMPPLSRDDFAKVFSASGTVDLHGSTVRHRILSPGPERVNDVDFGLLLNESYAEASPKFRRQFALAVLERAGIPLNGRLATPAQIDAFFAAFVFKETDVGNGLIKIRFHRPRTASPTFLPVEIVARPPDLDLAEADEIHRSFAVKNVASESPTVAGPSEKLLEWLDAHHILWFSPHIQGGLLRLLKHSSNGKVSQLLQPELVASFVTKSSTDERRQACYFLLRDNPDLQFDLICTNLRNGTLRTPGDFRRGIATQLAKLVDPTEIDAVTFIHNYFIPGSKQAASPELNLKLKTAYSNHLIASNKAANYIDSTMQFLCSHPDQQCEWLEQTIAARLPFANYETLGGLWSDLQHAPKSDIHEEQCAMLLEAIAYYDSALATQLRQAADAKSPSQAADKYLKILQQAQKSHDAVAASCAEALLPDLIARSDSGNRWRLISLWLTYAPHSAAAVSAMLAAPATPTQRQAILAPLCKAAERQPSSVLYLSIARVYVAMGQLAKANDAIVKAGIQARTHEDRLAVLDLIEEEFNDSFVALMNTLQKRQPRELFWSCHSLLFQAQLAQENNNLEGAITHTTAALAIDEHFDEARQVRAEIYKQQQNHGEAQRDFVELVKRHPDQMLNLGRCYYHLGFLDKALHCFETYEAINPNDSGLLRNLATLYWKQGQAERSLSYLERLCQKYPDNEDFVRDLGKTLYHLAKTKPEYHQRCADAWVNAAALKPISAMSEPQRNLLATFSLDIVQHTAERFYTLFQKTGNLYYFGTVLLIVRENFIGPTTSNPNPEHIEKVNELLLRLFQAVPENILFEADSKRIVLFNSAHTLVTLLDFPSFKTHPQLADACLPVLLQLAQFWHSNPPSEASTFGEVGLMLGSALMDFETPESRSAGMQCIVSTRNICRDKGLPVWRILHAMIEKESVEHAMKSLNDFLLTFNSDRPPTADSAQSIELLRQLLGCASAKKEVLESAKDKMEYAFFRTSLMTLLDYRYQRSTQNLFAFQGISHELRPQLMYKIVFALTQNEQLTPELVLDLLKLAREHMEQTLADGEKRYSLPLLASLSSMLHPRGGAWRQVHDYIGRHFNVDASAERPANLVCVLQALLYQPIADPSQIAELLAKVLYYIEDKGNFEFVQKGKWQAHQFETMISALNNSTIEKKLRIKTKMINTLQRQLNETLGAVQL